MLLQANPKSKFIYMPSKGDHNGDVRAQEMISPLDSQSQAAVTVTRSRWNSAASNTDANKDVDGLLDLVSKIDEPSKVSDRKTAEYIVPAGFNFDDEEVENNVNEISPPPVYSPAPSYIAGTDNGRSINAETTPKIELAVINNVKDNKPRNAASVDDFLSDLESALAPSPGKKETTAPQLLPASIGTSRSNAFPKVQATASPSTATSGPLGGNNHTATGHNFLSSLSMPSVLSHDSHSHHSLSSVGTSSRDASSNQTNTLLPISSGSRTSEGTKSSNSKQNRCVRIAIGGTSFQRGLKSSAFSKWYLFSYIIKFKY
jgi:hypothetical protein